MTSTFAPALFRLSKRRCFAANADAYSDSHRYAAFANSDSDCVRYADVYSNPNSDAQLYADGNAKTSSIRTTKDYAQAEINACSPAVSGT